MKTRRPRPINIYALDDLIEQWIPSKPYTPEERVLLSAYIADSKKKNAAKKRRRAKFEAWKAELRSKKRKSSFKSPESTHSNHPNSSQGS